MDAIFHSKIEDPEKVQCANCGMIYQRPTGLLTHYRCARCGNTALVPLKTSPDKQASLAIIGALAGAAVGGLPGAIVGGIAGLLAGSNK